MPKQVETSSELIVSYSPDRSRKQTLADCLRELAHDLETVPQVKVVDIEYDRYATSDSPYITVTIEGTPEQLDAFRAS